MGRIVQFELSIAFIIIFGSFQQGSHCSSDLKQEIDSNSVVLKDFTAIDRFCPGTYWFCPYGCHTFSLIQCLTECKQFTNYTIPSDVQPPSESNDAIRQPNETVSGITHNTKVNQFTCTGVRYQKGRSSREKCAFYFGDPWCYRGATVDSTHQFLFYVRLEKGDEDDQEKTTSAYEILDSEDNEAYQATTKAASSTLKHDEDSSDAAKSFLRKYFLKESQRSSAAVSKAAATWRQANLGNISDKVAPHKHSSTVLNNSSRDSGIKKPSLSLAAIRDSFQEFGGTCYGQFWRCPACLVNATARSRSKVNRSKQNAENLLTFNDPTDCMILCVREQDCGGFKFDRRRQFRCEILLTAPKAVCLSGVAPRSTSSISPPPEDSTTTPGHQQSMLPQSAEASGRANEPLVKNYNDSAVIFLRKNLDDTKLLIL